jgi:tyrosine-protein kinase Etk/Wzc
MGLFYTALERAEQQAAAEAPPTATPAAPAADWQEAEARDLAGFPLAPAALPTQAPAEPAAAPAKATPAPSASVLGLELTADSAAREQYRILRARVREGLRAQGLRTLLITSAGPGEGKTMVAANLALHFSALKELRVLLIDADLRRAGLSQRLHPQPEVGLAQYLQGQVEWPELLVSLDPWLTMLPSVRTQGDASELLASERMAALLEQAAQRFDLILLDGAPVGPVADSRTLARMTGASLLVARAAVTPTAALEQAAVLLRPGLLGSVLNDAALARRSYGYSYTEPGEAAS